MIGIAPPAAGRQTHCGGMMIYRYGAKIIGRDHAGNRGFFRRGSGTFDGLVRKGPVRNPGPELSQCSRGSHLRQPRVNITAPPQLRRHAHMRWRPRAIMDDVFRPRPEELYRAVHLSRDDRGRSEEHTSELQSLMRISYAVLCLKKNNNNTTR